MDHPSATHEERPLASGWLWLAAMAGLAAIIAQVILLGRWGLWHDEVMTLADCQADLWLMLKHRLIAGHAPLYFLLTWGWGRLVDWSDALLRLPAMLANLALASGTFIFLHRAGYRRTATLALLVLLLNPVLVAHGAMVRMYTFVALAGAVSCFLLWRLQAQPPLRGRANFLALTAVLAAGLLTHYSFLMVLTAIAMWLLLRRRPRWRPLIAVGVALVLALPWMVVFVFYRPAYTGDPLNWLPPPNWHAPLVGFTALTLGQHVHRWPLSLTLSLAGAIIALALLGARRLRPCAPLLLWVWLGPLAIALLWALLRQQGSFSTVSRYFLVSLWAQAVLLSAGLVTLAQFRHGRLPAASLTVLLLVTAGYNITTSIRQPRDPPWREVAHLVHQLHSPDEPVVLLSGGGSPCFRLYFQRAFHDLHHDRYHHAGTDQLWPRPLPLENIPLDAPVIWVVLEPRVIDPSLDPRLAFPPQIRHAASETLRQLQLHHHVQLQAQFPFIQLLRLTRRPD